MTNWAGHIDRLFGKIYCACLLWFGMQSKEWCSVYLDVKKVNVISINSYLTLKGEKVIIKPQGSLWGIYFSQ